MDVDFWRDPVEFPLPGCHRPVAGPLGNGEIYIVNYIVDEAPKAQIRGYSLIL